MTTAQQSKIAPLVSEDSIRLMMAFAEKHGLEGEGSVGLDQHGRAYAPIKGQHRVGDDVGDLSLVVVFHRDGYSQRSVVLEFSSGGSIREVDPSALQSA